MQVSRPQSISRGKAGAATAATVRHATQADLNGMVAIVAACGLDWTRDCLQVRTLLTALSHISQASGGCHTAILVQFCDGRVGLPSQKEIEKDCARLLLVDSRNLLCAMLVAWLVADEVRIMTSDRLQC